MAKGNQGHCSSRGIARWCRRAYPLNTLHTCALRHFARLPWRIGRVGGCAGFGAGGCGWAVPPLERCQVFPGYPPIVEDCSGLRARDRAFLDLKSETCNFEEKVFLARFRFGRQPALSLVGSPCLRGHLLLRVHRADESLMKPYLLTALNIVYFSLFAAWRIMVEIGAMQQNRGGFAVWADHQIDHPINPVRLCWFVRAPHAPKHQAEDQKTRQDRRLVQNLRFSRTVMRVSWLA